MNIMKWVNQKAKKHVRKQLAVNRPKRATKKPLIRTMVESGKSNVKKIKTETEAERNRKIRKQLDANMPKLAKRKDVVGAIARRKEQQRKLLEEMGN